MKLLISSCLVGENVRYDGSNNQILEKEFDYILNNIELYPLCPEVLGGLATPRNPAEIKENKVFTNNANDVSSYFIKGAKASLEICLKHNIKVALLKAKSPSCGLNKIYDGTFSKNLISGHGITTQLLINNGIKVFNETNLKECIAYIKELIK